MVRIFLFFTFIIVGNSLTISDLSKTVLYGSPVTIVCSGAAGISWTVNGEDASTDATINIEEASGTTKSTLIKSSIIEESIFRCYKSLDESSVTIAVATIAGVSSPLCREECEVSCTLASLTDTNKPTQTTWSGPDFTGLNGAESKLVKDTKYTHRLGEYKYTSQQSHLKIQDLEKTSYFTCTFELADSSTLQYTVSALIRPTNDCDTSTCADKGHCHSTSVVTNSACAKQCQSCYTYQYVLGEFIDSGQCVLDKNWCLDYLGEGKGMCKGDADPIVEYCRKCGFCLNLEFSTGKLLLPLIIFGLLCGLLALMCYKNYEEKRLVLPKVHVTNTETGKDKRAKRGSSHSSSRAHTVIPNHLIESSQFLAPSAALKQRSPTPPEDDQPLSILELNDPRMVAALRSNNDSPPRNGGEAALRGNGDSSLRNRGPSTNQPDIETVKPRKSSEEQVDFGSADDVRVGRYTPASTPPTTVQEGKVSAMMCSPCGSALEPSDTRKISALASASDEPLETLQAIEECVDRLSTKDIEVQNVGEREKSC